jgi:Uma2 family endonuclease
MVATAGSIARMSATEYLEWEQGQRDKHQFIGGHVYAMAGGSPRHNRLCANVLGRLYVSLRGGPCGPFSSDQKIYIPATGNFVYPDASVVCAAVQLHSGTTDVIDNPKVLIEVLSRSTEHHDRGDKWEDYQSVPSLTDYVLVSQRIPRIEHFGREPDGSWRYRVAGAGGRLELSTGTVLVVDEIYEGAFDVPGDD